jgi:hypothetical protein
MGSPTVLGLASRDTAVGVVEADGQTAILWRQLGTSGKDSVWVEAAILALAALGGEP